MAGYKAALEQEDDRYAVHVLKEERRIESPFLRDLSQTNEKAYYAIVSIWTGIAAGTPGQRNRFALGHSFKKLQMLYSQKSIGGNRRFSGPGIFEQECSQRGYAARTVRGWIADYEAILNGTFTEAQKRAARTQAKTPKVERLLADLEKLDVSALKAVRAKIDKLLARHPKENPAQWVPPTWEEEVSTTQGSIQ